MTEDLIAANISHLVVLALPAQQHWFGRTAITTGWSGLADIELNLPMGAIRCSVLLQ
ncbi:MAG: hypothetical protein R2844_02030 [Caldilineales bacterium]